MEIGETYPKIIGKFQNQIKTTKTHREKEREREKNILEKLKRGWQWPTERISSVAQGFFFLLAEFDVKRSLGFFFLLPFLPIAVSLGVFSERESVMKGVFGLYFQTTIFNF